MASEKILKNKIVFFSFYIFILSFGYSKNFYQTIQNLNSRDSIFKQYIQEVEANYININSRKPVELNIYKYTVKSTDTLTTIAARCSIIYDTIATLNKIPSIDTDLTGQTILLPTAVGLFRSDEPKNLIDYFLHGQNFDNSVTLWYNINGTNFEFFQNQRFSPTARAFFLDSKMISPLPAGTLSSSFGLRISPITGQEKFHNGIDIAASEGTPTFACLSGRVTFCGWDDVYGNYVIIQHDGNKQSIYAHLQSYSVKPDDIVRTGEVIGNVGTTGLSTSLHLHFEIKVSGVATDPKKLLYGY